MLLLLQKCSIYPHHTAFTDYTPVDTAVTLSPQTSTFQLSIALLKQTRGMEFYVRLTHQDAKTDVVNISSPSLTIRVDTFRGNIILIQSEIGTLANSKVQIDVSS